MKEVRIALEIIGVVVLGMIALVGLAGAPADDAPLGWYIATLIGSKVIGGAAGYYAYRLAEHCDLLITNMEEE